MTGIGSLESLPNIELDQTIASEAKPKNVIADLKLN
jgi:hypothetical protein